MQWKIRVCDALPLLLVQVSCCILARNNDVLGLAICEALNVALDRGQRPFDCPRGIPWFESANMQSMQTNDDRLGRTNGESA
jgi:hypothetical protein